MLKNGGTENKKARKEEKERQEKERNYRSSVTRRQVLKIKMSSAGSETAHALNHACGCPVILPCQKKNTHKITVSFLNGGN